MTRLRPETTRARSAWCRAAQIRRVVEILEETHGSPRHGNKDDPFDELMFIILSQMTTQPSFDRVFESFRSKAGGWADLTSVPVKKIAAWIKDAGLSREKAPRLTAIATELCIDFGFPTLEPLRSLGDEEMEAYLLRLPGVGLKTAKCVMMYSFGREVLPADTHVGRLAVRLGMVTPGLSSKALHRDLEAVVPPPLRYSFHVNGLAHGRAFCRSRVPLCGTCPLKDLCPESPRGAAEAPSAARPG